MNRGADEVAFMDFVNDIISKRSAISWRENRVLSRTIPNPPHVIMRIHMEQVRRAFPLKLLEPEWKDMVVRIDYKHRNACYVKTLL